MSLNTIASRYYIYLSYIEIKHYCVYSLIITYYFLCKSILHLLIKNIYWYYIDHETGELIL